MAIDIFDINGALRDWDWLVANYGDVRIQSPGDEPCYRVVELREKHDESAFIVQVRMADGVPQQGVDVVFYWDSADLLPDAGWLEQGVIGPTNENGDVGFGMGPGAYYSPPEQGPHKTWISGEGVSEMVEGIGMIAATNHNHFNVVYQWVEDEPEPEPEPEDLSAIVEVLERIAVALEKVAGLFA